MMVEGQTDVEVEIVSCLDVGAKGKHIRPEEGTFSVTFIYVTFQKQALHKYIFGHIAITTFESYAID